ncbi:MAG: glycosyltransferase family 4 protein, partial [Bacteroidia bacterium]|nr:glycosyltransferase family 4 protein [Bacteroidia bacterium]
VYLGRGTPEKRVFLVGKLATALRKSHPAIRFLLVGDLYGAVLPEDRQACDFAGVVNTPDSMRSILEDAHVVVLTSSREGMPLAIMEGMAHGLVPVTTGVGDLPEVLENGIDSIVVDPEDADQVVSGMMRSISELYADRRRLNRMSAAAHDKAQQLFNRERFAASYRSLLQAQQ